MRKRLLSLGLIMVLCFSLTGCKSSDYKKAVELQNSGDYAGALELFKGIGDDYKDVSDRATECQSFIDSITAFDEAKSLLDDKNAELDKAISEANDLVNGENTALDESLRSLLETINEQISNFAQTYPTNLKASSNEALLFMRRYRFANCSCFSCCFKDAYPSSNVQ